MIKVTDLKVYKSLDFADYLKLDAMSFSGLKFQAPFEATAKMRLGTGVHNYLAKDGSYDGQNFKLVRAIARAVIAFLPAGIIGEPEVSFSCTLTYCGYRMRFKGRVDLLCKRLVIDYKVSEGNLQNSINHFGYDYQITGYCLPFFIPRGIIIQVHPHTQVVTPVLIDPSTCIEYWCKKILDYGDEIKTIITKI